MGIKPFHGRQVYKWVYQMDTLDFDKMTNLSKELRATLKETFEFGLPRIDEKVASQDGSIKFLFLTNDDHSIESVFMPEDGRSTLCLSTQVGCKMSCAFCVTGKIGFMRNLAVSEIVGQIMAIKPHAGENRITNVVLMGMGEPLDNLDNVLKAIEIMEEPLGLKISHRRLTISTVGLVDGLRRLDHKKVQIAISLNAATGAVRTRLMPINRVHPLEGLIAHVKGLGDMGRRRVTFEYVMLKGINDSLRDARMLAELLKGVRCKINLIPYNESPYEDFKSPDEAAVKRFRSYLIDRRFTAIVRDSRARDIGGGCGAARHALPGRAHAMSLLPFDRESFFTGKNWPDGPPLRLHFDEGKVYADITLNRNFEGYENVVFGGMLFGILDVIMWYSIVMGTRKICMTRKTDMEFLKPVMCGITYRAEGELLRVEERDVWATAWIRDKTGERYAQATALFRQAKGIDNSRAGSRFDFSGVSPEDQRDFPVRFNLITLYHPHPSLSRQSFCRSPPSFQGFAQASRCLPR